MDGSRGDSLGDTDTVSMSMDIPLLTGLGLTPLSLGSCSSMFTEYFTYNYYNCVCVHFEVSHTQMCTNVLFVFICFCLFICNDNEINNE